MLYGVILILAGLASIAVATAFKLGVYLIIVSTLIICIGISIVYIYSGKDT